MEKKIPFATTYQPNDSKKYVQNWDRTKITITKAGQTYNVYDAIQAATEDTEIYAVLEKYNCLDPITKQTTGIYADFRNAMSLRNLQDKYIEINKVFESMTHEERAIFGNNIRNFIEHGEQYLISKTIGEKNQNEQKNNNTISTEKTQTSEQKPDNSRQTKN